MSTATETQFSATVELTQWAASIVAASTYRFLSNNVDSNKVVLGAISLMLLMATYVSYRIMNYFTTRSFSIEVSEYFDFSTTKATKITDSEDVYDDFPAINLVSTEDSQDSLEEDHEEWKETVPIQSVLPKETTIVIDIADDDTNDESEDEEDDNDDWNEEDYKRRYPVSEPVVTRSRNVSRPVVTRSRVTKEIPKRTVARTTTRTATRAASNPPKPTTTKNVPKKETIAQMRKRVAREMKESEERRRNQLGVTARQSTSRKRARKETVSEMKARVAREFAAKLKK